MLHIVDGLDPDSGSMVRILSDLGNEVTTFTDVYRALAWLGRDESRHIGVVLVCVDSLGARELAFFEQVRGVRPDVVRLVYSRRGHSGRVERAIRAGATRGVELTADSLGGALGRSDGDSPAQRSPGNGEWRMANGEWGDRIGAETVGRRFDRSGAHERGARRGALLTREELEALGLDGVGMG